jgi:HEAT repeat protein
MQRRFALSLVLLLAAGCGGRSTENWLGQLKDPEVVKRRQAIRELGGRAADAEQVVPALAEALRDGNGYVRHDAATTLGKFGSAARPAVPTLVAALKDKERTVRTAAAAALKKIDPQAGAKAERP